MRASRLLSILTTLQARGLTSAEALAEECGVSLRTIYRDIDALSSAGIPVLSERGAEGGYRLLHGYRTQLNGLSEKEAEALFLTGLSGPAADLGLHAVLVAAEKKLMSALPAPLRAGAEKMRARFHLDAPAWFKEAEKPKLLPLVASSVWEQRRIRMRYRSWKSEKPRVIDPLGLVLKGGSWYVIGQTEEGLRTYRVARILKLDVLEARFERPKDFELEAYWSASTKRLESELHPNQATVRMSPWALSMLEIFTSPFARAAARIEPGADSEGWCTVTLPVGSLREACTRLLCFGGELEVLEPAELRRKMAEVAARMHETYGRVTESPVED
jgi:predicted DNA-binding transcriptional regulator YafY